MITRVFIIIILAATLFSSCKRSSSPRQIAQETCDCLKKGNFYDFDLYDYDFDNRREVEKCGQVIMKKVIEELKERDHESRKRYIKDLMRAFLDTECYDRILDLIPFERVFSEFDEDYEDYTSEFDLPGMGIDVCDCVDESMKPNPDEEFMKKCEEKFDSKNMSEREMEELMEMVKNCDSFDY